MNTEDLNYSVINPVRRTSRGCVKDIGRPPVEPLSQESLRNLGLGSSMENLRKNTTHLILHISSQSKWMEGRVKGGKAAVPYNMEIQR